MKISKENVPLGPALHSQNGAASVIAALGVACLSIPPITPGLLEFVLGCVIGLVSSPLMAWGFIAFMKELAIQTKHKPYLRWSWLICRPASGNVWYFHLAFVLCFAGLSVGLGSQILLAVWRQYPDLALPLARFASAPADIGHPVLWSVFGEAAVSYWVVMFVAGECVGAWYKSLPE